MQHDKIIRVALIGPESSGKTTLVKQLAQHYKTSFVEEYARLYIQRLNRPYTLDDVTLIAAEQLEQEEKLIPRANKLFFTDTEFIIAKIWCEDVFKSCPEWIEKMILSKAYDLYLLLQPDLPWIKDAVRENPHRRKYFFDLYEKELINGKFNYKIISGTGEKRLQKAVAVINTFINTKRT